MYLLRLDGFDIVGSSPESLVTVRDGKATTHPIAGTRWRSADPDEDALLEKDLLADHKERAEHLMLVDLGRNDLGRVCKPGSVHVVDFFKVERYSHVMHIVSTVTGELAEGRTAFDAVAACFPAGTLSGAPKPRAMELIEELEPTRRGLYGGVVGYLDFAGDADTAIAIRTALVRDGVAYVQAGGGIVADSDPVAEDNECLNKAGAVLAAIATAQTMAPGGRAELPAAVHCGSSRRSCCWARRRRCRGCAGLGAGPPRCSCLAAPSAAAGARAGRRGRLRRGSLGACWCRRGRRRRRSAGGWPRPVRRRRARWACCRRRWSRSARSGATRCQTVRRGPAAAARRTDPETEHVATRWSAVTIRPTTKDARRTCLGRRRRSPHVARVKAHCREQLRESRHTRWPEAVTPAGLASLARGKGSNDW